MKPPPFAYADPATLPEALELLASDEDAVVLAGGQSLVPLLNLRLARPSLVVDLRRLPGLDRVEVSGGVMRIGASVTAASLMPVAAAAGFGGLAEALGWIGHPQIRARTTVGGSIAHADPSAELPTVLAACGGEVLLVSTAGERRVAAAEFFDGPFSTDRRPGELLVEVALPVPEGPSTFVEVARRPGDFAMVGLFLARGGPVRLGLSGVGSVPVCPPATIEALASGDLEAAAVALAGELRPEGDIHAGAEHRRAMAVALLRRAWTALELQGAA